MKKFVVSENFELSKSYTRLNAVLDCARYVVNNYSAIDDYDDFTTAIKETLSYLYPEMMPTSEDESVWERGMMRIDEMIENLNKRGAFEEAEYYDEEYVKDHNMLRFTLNDYWFAEALNIKGSAADFLYEDENCEGIFYPVDKNFEGNVAYIAPARIEALFADDYPDFTTEDWENICGSVADYYNEMDVIPTLTQFEEDTLDGYCRVSDAELEILQEEYSDYYFDMGDNLVEFDCVETRWEIMEKLEEVA